MDRQLGLGRLDEPWDIVIIGGGATGLGVGVDSVSRGYRTLVIDRFDFGKGTSSRSTKLIHGGLRYLKQGNVSLVFEALRERGRLIRNAPHIVHDLPFVIPVYDWWDGPFYGFGLKVYDLLAGDLGLSPSRRLSVDETIAQIPTLEREGLRGGVEYHDGQFDDSRLAISLCRTIEGLGGTVLNYCEVTDLLKVGGRVRGVAILDTESGTEHEVGAEVVVNATGVFTDDILAMDEPGSPRIIAPSRGVHIVLDRSFHAGSSAIMVPHTKDGRVLFAVPWHDRVIVGTTDTPVDSASFEPHPSSEEIDFLLAHAALYLTKDPTREDVLSCFAGLRPLVADSSEEKTAALSREHVVLVSDSGLVTATGGKWTTYRKMAEETVDRAALEAGLEDRESITRNLQIHGWTRAIDTPMHLRNYGTDGAALDSIARNEEGAAEPLHPSLPYRQAEVRFAARYEMARTVEDVLSRRTRALLLDARASISAAPTVARILASELGRDAAWESDQVHVFTEVAQGYLC